MNCRQNARAQVQFPLICWGSQSHAAPKLEALVVLRTGRVHPKLKGLKDPHLPPPVPPPVALLLLGALPGKATHDGLVGSARWRAAPSWRRGGGAHWGVHPKLKGQRGPQSPLRSVGVVLQLYLERLHMTDRWSLGGVLPLSLRWWWCALGSAPQAQGSKGPSPPPPVASLLLAALPGKATHDGSLGSRSARCPKLGGAGGGVHWECTPSSKCSRTLTRLLLLHRSSLNGSTWKGYT